MNSDQKVILRDAGIFALKLWVDSIKDIVLAFVCLGAAFFDMIRGPRTDGYRFYRVMKLGRRIDEELNLYGHGEPPAQTIAER